MAAGGAAEHRRSVTGPGTAPPTLLRRSRIRGASPRASRGRCRTAENHRRPGGDEVGLVSSWVIHRTCRLMGVAPKLKHGLILLEMGNHRCLPAALRICHLSILDSFLFSFVFEIGSHDIAFSSLEPTAQTRLASLSSVL